MEQATGSHAGRRVSTGPDRDHLSYSAPAAAVLRDAVVEAIQRGHNYIGTEHLLLALVRDPDTPVAQLLAQLGASPAETRVRVTELLHGFKKPSPGRGGAGRPGPRPPAPPRPPSATAAAPR